MPLIILISVLCFAAAGVGIDLLYKRVEGKKRPETRKRIFIIKAPQKRSSARKRMPSTRLVREDDLDEWPYGCL